MAKIKARLPSKKDALTVLMVCAFPIYVWSIIYTFVEIPAWIIRSNTWDLIGLIAYTQAFALFESLSIWCIFLLIGFILPAKFFRDRIVAFSAIIVFTTTVWFIIAHFNSELISDMPGKQLLFWLFIFGLSVIGMYILVFRFAKLGRIINTICERLSVLSTLYLLIGALSLIIVFIRNIF